MTCEGSGRSTIQIKLLCGSECADSLSGNIEKKVVILHRAAIRMYNSLFIVHDFVKVHAHCFFDHNDVQLLSDVWTLNRFELHTKGVWSLSAAFQ